MAEERDDIIPEDGAVEDAVGGPVFQMGEGEEVPSGDAPAGLGSQGSTPGEDVGMTSDSGSDAAPADAKPDDGERHSGKVTAASKEKGDAKTPDKKKSSGKKEKAGGDVVGYVKGISSEMKRTTWPKGREVLSWSLVVTAVIALFALLMFVMDNLIATPIMFAISGLAVDDGFGLKAILLTVAFFFTGIGTAIGVLLHAGGDSNGLSDNLSTQLTGGSAIAEKNLDRITIIMAIAFAVVIALMMVFFPTGTVFGA